MGLRLTEATIDLDSKPECSLARPTRPALPVHPCIDKEENTLKDDVKRYIY